MRESRFLSMDDGAKLLFDAVAHLESSDWPKQIKREAQTIMGRLYWQILNEQAQLLRWG